MQTDKYIVHSYEVYTAPESLEDRLPYLDPPFTSDINPHQITHAVWDRAISKLAEVLEFNELSAQRKRDALITMNKLVSHQETMDEMIDEGVVQAASALLSYESEDVRQQAAILLGAFTNSERAREEFESPSEELQKLLVDVSLKVREAAAWAFYKLSLSRSGCEKLVYFKSIDKMIAAFLHYMARESLAFENGRFFIYLLEAAVNVSNYDLGIKPFLETGIIRRLTEILERDAIIVLKDYIQRVQELSLKVLAHLSFNHGPTEEIYDGAKQECIDSKTILECWRYLDSEVYHERLNASVILMSLSIHLRGKDQIVFQERLPLLSPTPSSGQVQGGRSEGKLSEGAIHVAAAPMSEAPLTSEMPQPSDEAPQPSQIPTQAEGRGIEEEEKMNKIRVEENEGRGRPAIIAKIVERLGVSGEQGDLRENLKITLHNVITLPAGFLEVSRELGASAELFEEIFATKAIVGISLLLPKFTDYGHPNNLTAQELRQNAGYIKTLGFIFQKHGQDAAHVASTECINLVCQLLPFINPAYKLEGYAMRCILQITSSDEYSCFLLQKLFQKTAGLKLVGVNMPFQSLIEQFPDLAKRVKNADILQ